MPATALNRLVDDEHVEVTRRGARQQVLARDGWTVPGNAFSVTIAHAVLSVRDMAIVDNEGDGGECLHCANA